MYLLITPRCGQGIRLTAIPYVHRNSLIQLHDTSTNLLLKLVIASSTMTTRELVCEYFFASARKYT